VVRNSFKPDEVGKGSGIRLFIFPTFVSQTAKFFSRSSIIIEHWLAFNIGID